MNNTQLREFFKSCVAGEIIQLNTTIMGSYCVTTKTEDQYGDSYYYGHYEKSIKLYMKIDAIGSHIILFDRNYFNDNNKELSDFLSKSYPLDQMDQRNDISNIESVNNPKLGFITGLTDDKLFLLDMSSLLYIDKNLKRQFTFSKLIKSKGCKYIPCYSSSCCGAKCANDFCDEHITKKCLSCGEQATHECNHTGQFVCGAPLCDNCHGVDGGGTWGFIGHKHIKKDFKND